MVDSLVQLQQAEKQLYQRASELLATVHDLSGFAATMSAYTGMAEDLAGQRPVACQAGCSHCCVLNVAVLLPEAAAIAAWFLLQTDGENREELLSRLQRFALKVRWMEDSERVHRQTVCPFLDGQGRCSIYPVRPLSCRGVTSLDRAACLSAFDSTVFDTSLAVPMDTSRRMVMDAAFCSLARALEEKPMMSRSIELCAGVAAFLADSELVQVLIAGEDLPAGLWE